MTIPLYQIDAFTNQVFCGNPAAVCILESWLDNSILQKIAAENNLAETAFVLPKGNQFEIRWFTPTVEVDLCGHATLAAAHVLFSYYNISSEFIPFSSPRSGLLTVSKKEDLLTLDFPTDKYESVDCPSVLIQALDKTPVDCYKGKTDYLLIYENQKDIESAQPDLNLIMQAGERGVIISAPGNNVDFVSRFFAPQAGIDEDPVTGSAHTTLTPVWAKKLNKTKMTAQQLSSRKGDLLCEYLGNRVKITGQAVTYLKGQIIIHNK